MDIRAHAQALLSGIYVIVNEGAPNPVALARAILQGGARIVQYRAKNGIVPAHVRVLRELTRAHGALLILNDAWTHVETYEADGAHVGPDDADPRELGEIRASLRGRVLGVSCGTADEARLAQAAGADYAGVGCVFATESKADAGDPIGLAGLRAAASACTIPVAAIGGITRQSLPQIRASGVAMAAIISAIANAPDPQAATAALVRQWNTP